MPGSCRRRRLARGLCLRTRRQIQLHAEIANLDKFNPASGLSAARHVGEHVFDWSDSRRRPQFVQQRREYVCHSGTSNPGDGIAAFNRCRRFLTLMNVPRFSAKVAPGKT
jgi:hypothetical protein